MNPPLVRLVASAPVVLAGAKTDWMKYNSHSGQRPEWKLHHDFMTRNTQSILLFFTIARWACIPLSLVGGLTCYLWARDLYGNWAGLVSLGVWCFEPNILGNAMLITPDAAAAATGAAAGYTFWRWLKKPNWTAALLAGSVLGFAELTKSTWIVLLLLWPVLWLTYRRLTQGRRSPSAGLCDRAQMVLILLVGLSILNAGYGCEGSLQKLGDYGFVSQTLGGPNGRPAELEVRNRFRGTWLGEVRVPFPKNYVMGIDLQKWDFERGVWSYLGGEWRTVGWWYYYLYALVIKVPLAIWTLVVAAIVLSASRAGYSGAYPDECALLAPAIVVFVFVSLQSGMTHYVRYVLPIYPFVIVWISKIARSQELGHRGILAVLAAALLWGAGSSLWVYPHSLSYFNELVGGPKGGAAHLLDSNIDWGQDLLFLKRWIDDHPEAQPLGLAFWGSYDPSVIGIEYVRPPEGPPGRCDSGKLEEVGPLPGWYALSVTEIYGHQRVYEYFLRFEPVAMAGYSIYIYHITPEDANRVRRELGLPELPLSTPQASAKDGASPERADS